MIQLLAAITVTHTFRMPAQAHLHVGVGLGTREFRKVIAADFGPDGTALDRRVLKRAEEGYVEICIVDPLPWITVGWAWSPGRT